MLLLHGGATNATDTYFYLFSLGLTPTLILIVGVMYPMLLNRDGITQRGLRRIRWVTPVLAAACVLVGYGWLAANRDMGAALLVIACVMSLNSVLQAAIYYRSAAAEAGGDALWISGVALPANLAACAVLVWPWGSSMTATLAMVIALTVGNVVSLLLVTYRRVGQAVLDAAPEDLPLHRGSIWFLAKASVGYVSLSVFSTLAVTLPASSVTVLNLASKLVGAVATTLTNAVMPVLVHQDTQSTAGARKLLRLLAGGLSVVGGIATVAVAVIEPRLAPTAAVISLWAVSSSAAAVAQRTAFRFLPARAAGSVMAAVVVIVAVTIGLAALPGFDVTVLLCSFAMLDAASAALLLWRLKDRAASISSLLILASLAVLAGTAFF